MVYLVLFHIFKCPFHINMNEGRCRFKILNFSATFCAVNKLCLCLVNFQLFFFSCVPLGNTLSNEFFSAFNFSIFAVLISESLV